MAMGKHKRNGQPTMWVATTDLPTAASHPFYARLNQLLRERGFDDLAEAQCAEFYADTIGRPGLAPGIYFRLLLIGYFEGLDSERGSDSFPLQVAAVYKILGTMPKSLSGHELLPHSALLSLTDVQQSGTGWIVRADGPAQAACPRCRRVSRSRHSAYVRTLKDLPAVGATVALQIRVGRWRCGTRACAGRCFADRLPGVAEFRGRRTCRANVVARLIGYALGGRAGERLAYRIGLPISNDTLLRWVKKCAQPAVTGAQVIGIDEWAKRKGRTYGTIVVDLERHTRDRRVGSTFHRGRRTMAGGPS